MSDRRFSYAAFRIEHRHALAVSWIATDIALYASFVLCEMSPHQSIVTAVGIVVEELCTKMRFGFRCLGHHQQSAGVFVDAVHKSHLRVVRIISGQTAE